jgi:hypothetical protein
VPVVLRRSQTLETARIVVSATQRRAEELHAAWARLKVAEIRPVSAFTPKFVPLLLGECDAAIHLPVDDRETFVWDLYGCSDAIEGSRWAVHVMGGR